MEYSQQVITAIKNFIAKDTKAMNDVGENQEQTHLELIFQFIERML